MVSTIVTARATHGLRSRRPYLVPAPARQRDPARGRAGYQTLSDGIRGGASGGATVGGQCKFTDLGRVIGIALRVIPSRFRGLLLHERHDSHEPRCLVTATCHFGRCIRPRLVAGRWKSALGFMKQGRGKTNVMQIIGALHRPCRLTRCLNGRKEQADQHSQDGNDDQQFDECESSAARPTEEGRHMPDSRPRDPGRAAARHMVRVVDSGENRRSRPGMAFAWCGLDSLNTRRAERGLQHCQDPTLPERSDW